MHPPTASYDAFISYAHLERAAVQPIADALTAAGLTIWFDAVVDTEFKSITRSIEQGLAASKVLVAYYSRTYVTRRACQWELTAAFLAAQAAGDPRERIVVINPHDDGDHLQPVELRDAIYRSPGPDADPAALRDLAAAVTRRTREVSGPFGALRALLPLAWHGAAPRGSARFVGRLTDMWALHSGLHAPSAVITTSRQGLGLAQVRGLGGMGKSLLVEEYALRFGAAYPGGVFWLRAFGHEQTRGRSNGLSRDALRDGQLRDFAAGLGLRVSAAEPARVRGAIARTLEKRAEACLWIVDDLPSGLTREEQDLWLAPHPLARTIVTTRSQEYELGACVDLSLLTDRDAFELLTARRAPADADERAAARQLASLLGYHALATDVAGGALHALRGVHTFRTLHDELARPTSTALRLVESLGPQLPNGHEKSIVNTLLRSIDQLDDDARDFLRIASILGEAPIPVGLVAEMFAAVFSLAPGDAIARAVAACDRAALVSLAQRAQDDEGDVGVHALVSRTVQMQEETPQRVSALRIGAVQALTTTLVRYAEAGDRLNTDEQLAKLMPHVTAITRTLSAIDIDAMTAGLLVDVAGKLLIASGRLRSAEEVTIHGLALEGRGLGARDTAILRHRLGVVLFGRGRIAEAIEAYAEGLRQLPAGDSNDDVRAGLLSDSSVALRDTERVADARAAAFQALALRERRLGPDHRDVANALNNLGMVLRVTGELREAREAYERGLRIAATRDPGMHAKLLSNLGRLLMELKALDEARRTYVEALELIERLHGPNSMESAGTLNGLGMVTYALGERDAALGHLRRALAIVEAAEERDPRLEATILSELGRAQRDAGALRDAFHSFMRALPLDTEVHGPTHRTVAQDFAQLGVTLQFAHHDAEALEYLERGLEIRRSWQSPPDVDFVKELVNLSTSLWRTNAFDEAQSAILEADAILNRLPAAPPDVVARVLANLAPILRAGGHLVDARDAAERTIALNRLTGADLLTSAKGTLSLGRILVDMGERERGLGLVAQALTTYEQELGPEHAETQQLREMLAHLRSLPQP